MSSPTDRIILSRQTLSKYQQMGLPDLDRDLIRAEIEVLQSIAEEYPATAGKLANLIGKWRELLGEAVH